MGRRCRRVRVRCRRAGSRSIVARRVFAFGPFGDQPFRARRDLRAFAPLDLICAPLVSGVNTREDEPGGAAAGLVGGLGGHRRCGSHVQGHRIGGVGRDPCSAWVSGRGTTTPSAEAASQARIEWISGFLSAVNVFADRSGNLKGGVDDTDGVIRWIDKYCRAHPTDPLWTAAGALVLDLKNSPRE